MKYSRGADKTFLILETHWYKFISLDLNSREKMSQQSLVVRMVCHVDLIAVETTTELSNDGTHLM